MGMESLGLHLNRDKDMSIELVIESLAAISTKY